MTPESPELTQRELRRMWWRLRRRDPLRRVADALIAQDYGQIGDVELLIHALESRPLRWARRLVAAEALRFAELRADGAQQVESALVRIASRRDSPPLVRYGRRGGRLALQLCLLLAVAAVIGGFIVELIIMNPFPEQANTREVLSQIGMSLTAVLELTTALTLILSPLADVRRDERLREVALQCLGRWGRAESIEALAATASMERGIGMGAKALPPPRRVLKRLDSSDYGSVPPEGIRRLCDLLTDCNSRGLTYLAAEVPLVLKALGRVGGGNAVETVERIAESGRLPVWRAKARDILPILLERQRREQDAARLLRAADSQQNSASLLRPAAASSQPAELLLHTVPDDSTT